MSDHLDELIFEERMILSFKGCTFILTAAKKKRLKTAGTCVYFHPPPTAGTLFLDITVTFSKQNSAEQNDKCGRDMYDSLFL